MFGSMRQGIKGLSYLQKKDKSWRKSTIIPFHVDAAHRPKRVEAVEDPVARDLDRPHWKKKQGEAWNREQTEATEDTEPGRQHILEMNECWNISAGDNMAPAALCPWPRPLMRASVKDLKGNVERRRSCVISGVRKPDVHPFPQHTNGRISCSIRLELVFPGVPQGSPHPGGPLHSCGGQGAGRVKWAWEGGRRWCSWELWLHLERVGSYSEVDEPSSQKGFPPSSPGRRQTTQKTNPEMSGQTRGPISSGTCQKKGRGWKHFIFL